MVYLADVLEALGLAGAALVDKDEAVGAGQGQQPGQKVGVVCAGTAVEDNQRRAFAEFNVVDEHAVGVDVALVLGVDGGRACAAAGARLDGERRRKR